MSKADELYRQTCRQILDHGVWDTDYDVRPHWEDGTPAHTVKAFGVVNRYNLAEEFPIMTLRRTAFKSCIDELLWIWQKKSNRFRSSTAMYGIPGPMKTAPSAKPMAISWA